MPQLFPPSTNTWSRLSVITLGLLVAGSAWLLGAVQRSDYVTERNVVREQPVPFSHKHHVAGIGIDCRYCHTGAEDQRFAGVPPTRTCMTCHSQIWADSPTLEPVRASARSGRSLEWMRVHSLADFVYFDHGVHVQNGIGCSTCHGRVDQMPLTWRVATLHMSWCLECHRDPAQFVRPRAEVFAMEWTVPGDQARLGAQLVREYGIPGPRELTSCSVCHR